MSFRLDKNYFWEGKLEDKPSDAAYYGTLTMEQRLKIAFYLNSVAYNFDINNPPKMNKSVFTIRKRD
jgi:hypothetical protein